MTRRKLQPADDPTQGHYDVVVSFRVQTQELKDGGPDLIEAFVRNRLGRMKELTVHVRRVGAGGESSEMEGEWPPGGTSEPAHGDLSAAPGTPKGAR